MQVRHSTSRAILNSVSTCLDMRSHVIQSFPVGPSAFSKARFSKKVR